MLNLKHFQLLTQDREDSLRLLQKPSMRGIRAGIVEKYSEKAHFIYELLQNADDVGASEVRFLLRKNGLYFAHNGNVHFTVTAPNDTQNIGHINAITAIGDSTKSPQPPKGELPAPPPSGAGGIGKFGIGFKAVFQYTNTPHIYDPYISFKIRDLIVPVLLEQEAHPLRKNDETLFYFPFDRAEKTPKDAVEEIEDKLKSLQFPLLFLNNLKKINWESDNGTKGSFFFNENKEENESNELNVETHIQTLGKKTISSDILRFSTINVGRVQNPANVQIVFLLENQNTINFHKKHAAYCFFPTKVMTGLRFLVHAPFLLSDSREGIKQKERWNENLILQLAELLADSVEMIINAVRVQNPDSVISSESLFQALPFDKNDLDPLFAPLSDAVLQRLHQKELLPTHDFLTKVSIKNAYLAENKATQLLVTATGLNPLSQIFGENAHWIFTELSPNSKFFYTIKNYLTANQNVVTYDFLQQHLHKIEGKKQIETSSPLERIEERSFLGAVVPIYDSLSDEERLALMKSVEPNADYATWEEVEDYDIEGLAEFLDNEMTVEKSVLLWNFLSQSFDNQLFNKNNLYGKYTFAWQTEEHVFFEPFFLKRLKNTAWLYDTQNILQEITPLLKDFLHPQYHQNQALLDYLFQQEEKQIDRFAYLTDDEKHAIEIGKRFLEQGFSTDDLLELRRIKHRRGDLHGRPDNVKKERTKREKTSETEETEQISSAALLKKEQELRQAMEDELEEKMEQLIEIEQLKQTIQDSERYSMAWFKALLRLEYVLAYERQGKERSIQIHFDRIEREEGTDKTILLKRPSRPLPLDIEEANDITIKLQMDYGGTGDLHGRPKTERINLAVEVVSVGASFTGASHLRAKLKSPEEIADIDFSKIRGATLDMQNTIFVLEELTKSFNELPFEDDYNVVTNLQDDIRFIFGPPGTGKTTYLVQEEIQPAMLSDDELKVLVLTPTNKAADVLVLKTMKALGDNVDWLIRFGTTAEMDIENAGLLRDSSYNVEHREHFCAVTTITRFPYDGFNSGAWEYKFKNIAWDVIIVDEASMVGVGYMAYLLMAQPQAKFVIGGDPFQIEPVVLAEDWMGENVYSMVRLASFDPVVQRETLFPHQYKVLNLTTQYRSINTIGQLYSHFAYDGILKHHRFQKDQKKLILPDLPLKDINIIRFPAHKLEILYRPQLLNKSHYHLYSALLTVELTQYIAKNLHQNQPNEKFKIGIICPYKAQSTLVDKVIASLHLSFKNIEIQTGTIHSFQGDECNIVLCLFNPPPNITKSPNAFLNKMNILNVAISRAKDHLILLMPDENTDNVGNLYQLNRLQGIIKYYLAGVCQTWQSADIEQIIFNQDDYLYENTFATTHQSVNVYTKPEKKYEIRIEETAVDVQVVQNL